MGWGNCEDWTVEDNVGEEIEEDGGFGGADAGNDVRGIVGNEHVGERGGRGDIGI